MKTIKISMRPDHRSLLALVVSATALTAMMLVLCTTPVSGAERQVLRGHVPAGVARLGLMPLGRLPATNRLNGCVPSAGLVQGSDGNFYGTTDGGGAGSCGTVFQMTPAGVLTTLVSFKGANGNDPQGGLVQGTDGNFYGTTEYGGANGQGTVFQVTTNATLTTLVSF